MTTSLSTEEIARQMASQYSGVNPERVQSLLTGKGVTLSKMEDRSQRKAPRSPAGEPEHDEQVALMRWANVAKGRTPELGLLFAIPNGGKRNVVTAKKLKAEGVKAGVPDLCLPVARGGYHSLYIELKAGRGSVSDAQSAWHVRLREEGHAVRVAYGWEAARDAILRYLAGEITVSPL